MARYKDFKNDKFYKRPGTPVNQAPKPEIHFYPDITDEALKSDKYDIDFTLSYADVKKRHGRHLDSSNGVCESLYC